MDRLAIPALLFGIMLIPLQILPAMPVPGMIAGDLFLLLAGLATVAGMVGEGRPSSDGLGKIGLLGAATFAAWALGSAVVNDGLYSKLIGHFELVGIALMVAVWAGAGSRDERDDGRHRNRLLIERALVAAGLVAAVTAVAAAVLFYLGVDTALLNHR
ncbi:MAG: hypothetical protein KJO07_19730, partial [Deltaproteobacteria bacterium]|nr:hypothetical protein [Deltaproteobacteria bacterium]